jgi:hypothetical protein
MAYISFEPKDYFNIVLYTGSGNAQTISGVGFQPDWLWQKSRSASQDGRIFDSVQGGSKLIYPSLTNAVSTDTQLITSFNADGFTMGTSGSNANDSSVTYVAWNWLAGTSFTNDASGTGIGSIDSAGSVSTTSGFSIVKWTGTGATGTIAHGLGAVPRMILVKSLANTTSWMCQHASLGNAKEFYLNSASAPGSSTAWNSTTPTSTVFSVTGGAGDGVNASGDYIAYCFADVQGFSKISSYLGNGEASDNTFVYCGFKPKFILHKATIGENWMLWDSTRNTAVNSNGNPTHVIFEPNGAGGENNTTARSIDLLSNGFKIRGNNANFGGSGTEYVFMAFADKPLVSTNGVPANAN